MKFRSCRFLLRPALWPGLVAYLITVQAAHAQEAAPVEVRPGEIRLDGTIRAVDPGAETLTLEATSFVLPNGNSRPLQPPKTKLILLNAQTLLHVRGATERKVVINALHEGVFATVAGPDGGSGNALAAREVAVWQSVQNGGYVWNDAPPPAPQPQPAPQPDTAPDDARIQPVDINGGFEQLNELGGPAKWNFAKNANMSIEQDDKGNHFIHVSSADAHQDRVFATTLKLDPAWKTLKLSARMKLEHFKIGKASWQMARVAISFKDADDKLLGYGVEVALRDDTEWRTISAVSEIPKGADHVLIEAGLWSLGGELSIDDVQVRPNAAPDASALTPGFPEGTFDKLDEKGNVQGWDMNGGTFVTLQQEGGNHFLHILNDTPAIFVFINKYLRVDPAWKAIKVSARVRGKNIVNGKNGWERAHVGLEWIDSIGRHIGDWPPGPNLQGDADWQTQTVQVEVPRNAAFLKITPSFSGSTGAFDVDDIQITPLGQGQLAPPSLPIRPDLPEGTFENVDDQGHPEGWTLGRGITLQQDGDNHFLRLHNDNPNGVILTDTFFKLDPSWRGIIVRARLRSKDIKVGPESFHNARLGYAFADAAGKKVGDWPMTLDVRTDMDWRRLEARSLVPPGAVYVKVTPIMQNTTGTLDIDDLVVLEDKNTNLPRTATAIEPGFPPGTFENVDGAGNPTGWLLQDHTHIRVAEEDGNHFLRISNDDGHQAVSTEGIFKLDPAWQAIALRARLRAKNLRIGANPLEIAMLRGTFLDIHMEKLPAPAPHLQLKQDADWTTSQSTVLIPPGAAYIQLAPSLINATGTFDVDDIALTGVNRE